MSDIVTTDPVSPEAVEHILGTGDLSKLTTHQRVEYYAAVCKSMGLNPLTRPFRFMSFQGQTVMYATRDCTDQLRQIRKISIAITDKHLDGDLFLVTAQATAADGRRDEDVGAVSIGKLMGEARANATMKAMTKAKRRVTLSICGLGMLSEDEVETLPGARTFDHDATISERQAINDAVPLKAAAAPMPRPAVKRAAQPADGDVPKYAEHYAKYDSAIELLDETNPTIWLENLEMLLANANSQEEVVAIGGHPTVGNATAKAPPSVRNRVGELLASAFGRFVTETPDDLEIAGADKLAG